MAGRETPATRSAQRAGIRYRVLEPAPDDLAALTRADRAPLARR